MNYWFKPHKCFSVGHDPVCGWWNGKVVRSGMLPLCSFPLWRFLSNVDSTAHFHTVSTPKVSTYKIRFFLLLLLPLTVTRTGPLLHVPGPQTEQIIFSVSSSFTSMPRSSKIQRPCLKSWIFHPSQVSSPLHFLTPQIPHNIGFSKHKELKIHVLCLRVWNSFSQLER
jgi:hypothetical protein